MTWEKPTDLANKNEDESKSHAEEQTIAEPFVCWEKVVQLLGRGKKRRCLKTQASATASLPSDSPQWEPRMCTAKCSESKSSGWQWKEGNNDEPGRKSGRAERASCGLPHLTPKQRQQRGFAVSRALYVGYPPPLGPLSFSRWAFKNEHKVYLGEQNMSFWNSLCDDFGSVIDMCITSRRIFHSIWII